MNDITLTLEQRSLRDEARTFARKGVTRQLILDMDTDKINYPREYIQKLGASQLLGLLFPLEGEGADSAGRMQSWRWRRSVC